MRFIELKERKAKMESEIAELREMFLDDIEYAIPDKDNENVVNITIGKSTVTITSVVKPYFDTKKFGKEHPKLKAEYTTERAEDRVTATSER